MIDASAAARTLFKSSTTALDPDTASSVRDDVFPTPDDLGGGGVGGNPPVFDLDEGVECLLFGRGEPISEGSWRRSCVYFSWIFNAKY